METKLERIADKSRNEKKPIFTSLYHLINEEMLKSLKTKKNEENYSKME